jgi:hypothetical protein
MDALEFLKERKRMCDYYSHCKGCPLDGSKCVIDSAVSDENCKRFAATVEQWSKEHPRKTRQSVFLEQYPEARIGDDGVLQVDPCSISASYRNARNNYATRMLQLPPRVLVCGGGGMRDTDLVSAITGNTGDSGWRNMVPQVDSSDFPTQWVPSAYECSIIEAQAKEIERLRAQVVHGRWIYDEKAQRPYCSICKEYFYGATNSSMNYCSNCGAKMDGDDGHACL